MRLSEFLPQEYCMLSMHNILVITIEHITLTFWTEFSTLLSLYIYFVILLNWDPESGRKERTKNVKREKHQNKLSRELDSCQAGSYWYYHLTDVTQNSGSTKLNKHFALHQKGVKTSPKYSIFPVKPRIEIFNRYEHMKLEAHSWSQQKKKEVHVFSDDVRLPSFPVITA